MSTSSISLPQSDLWTCASTLVTIESPWVRMLAERWIDHQGTSLDYWRVEHAHSVIVIAVWREQILLPRPQFRPGVQSLTLDLPGGRMPANLTALETAPLLLKKELGLEATAIIHSEALNQEGWVINSSFSNQLLYGVVAHIDDSLTLDMQHVHRLVPVSSSAVAQLIKELECLQCRTVLQTWLLERMLI